MLTSFEQGVLPLGVLPLEEVLPSLEVPPLVVLPLVVLPLVALPLVVWKMSLPLAVLEEVLSEFLLEWGEMEKKQMKHLKGKVMWNHQSCAWWVEFVEVAIVAVAVAAVAVAVEELQAFVVGYILG